MGSGTMEVSGIGESLKVMEDFLGTVTDHWCKDVDELARFLGVCAKPAGWDLHRDKILSKESEGIFKEMLGNEHYAKLCAGIELICKWKGFLKTLNADGAKRVASPELLKRMQIVIESSQDYSTMIYSLHQAGVTC